MSIIFSEKYIQELNMAKAELAKKLAAEQKSPETMTQRQLNAVVDVETEDLEYIKACIAEKDKRMNLFIQDNLKAHRENPGKALFKSRCSDCDYFENHFLECDKNNPRLPFEYPEDAKIKCCLMCGSRNYSYTNRLT
jgi:trehalose/maltose hydrolase-like predicted phosphorylase